MTIKNFLENEKLIDDFLSIEIKVSCNAENNSHIVSEVNEMKEYRDMSIADSMLIAPSLVKYDIHKQISKIIQSIIPSIDNSYSFFVDVHNVKELYNYKNWSDDIKKLLKDVGGEIVRNNTVLKNPINKFFICNMVVSDIIARIDPDEYMKSGKIDQVIIVIENSINTKRYSLSLIKEDNAPIQSKNIFTNIDDCTIYIKEVMVYMALAKYCVEIAHLEKTKNRDIKSIEDIICLNPKNHKSCR